MTNKPTMAAIGGVYTVLWVVYLNKEIEYMSTSPFIDIKDKRPKSYFNHINPTKAHKL